MARVKSSAWSVARGSIGGTNYLSGPHHGIIARTRTSPVQPTSTASSLYRSSFALANVAWRNLSPADRIRWAEYASTLYFPSDTGPYTVTGRNVFLAYYATHHYFRTLIPSGPPVRTNASEADGWLPLIAFPGPKSVLPDQTLHVILINGSTVERLSVYLQLSRPFDSTRHFHKGPWSTRTLQYYFLNPATSSPVTFYGLRTDAYYFVRIRAVTTLPLGCRYTPEIIIRHQAY